MKVALLSDLHGQLPSIDHDTDFIIVAGDIGPDSHFMGQAIESAIMEQEEWFAKDFHIWRAEQGFRPLYGTWGNHDFYGNRIRNYNHKDCQIVTDQMLEIEGVKVWFCPWSKTIQSDIKWTFQRDDVAGAFNDIPVESEVLIVHGPPLGLGDLLVGSRGPFNVGSVTLLNRLRELKRLKFAVTGHIHEARGLYAAEDVGVPVFNVACLDRSYNLRKQPVVYIDWEANQQTEGYGHGV